MSSMTSDVIREPPSKKRKAEPGVDAWKVHPVASEEALEMLQLRTANRNMGIRLQQNRSLIGKLESRVQKLEWQQELFQDVVTFSDTTWSLLKKSESLFPLSESDLTEANKPLASLVFIDSDEGRHERVLNALKQRSNLFKHIVSSQMGGAQGISDAGATRDLVNTREELAVAKAQGAGQEGRIASLLQQVSAEQQSVREAETNLMREKERSDYYEGELQHQKEAFDRERLEFEEKFKKAGSVSSASAEQSVVPTSADREELEGLRSRVSESDAEIRDLRDFLRKGRSDYSSVHQSLEELRVQVRSFLLTCGIDDVNFPDSADFLVHHPKVVEVLAQRDGLAQELGDLAKGFRDQIDKVELDRKNLEEEKARALESEVKQKEVLRGRVLELENALSTNDLELKVAKNALSEQEQGVALSEERRLRSAVEVRNKGMREEIDRLRAMQKDLGVESGMLSVSSLKLELQALRAEKGEWISRKGGSDSDGRLEEVLGELEATRAAANEMELEHEAVAAELEAVANAFEELQTSNAKLLDEVKARESSAAKLQKERIRASQVQILMQEERKVLVSQYETARRRVEEVSLELKAQKDVYGSLAEAHELLKTEAARSRAMVEMVRYDRAKYLQKQEVDQFSLHSLTEKAAALEAQLRSRTGELSQMERDLKSAQEEYALAQRKLARFERTRGPIEVTSKDDMDRELRDLNMELRYLKGIVKCPKCGQNDRDAIIVRCGHMYCKNCLQQRIRDRARKCPSCNGPFAESDVRDVFFT